MRFLCSLTLAVLALAAPLHAQSALGPLRVFPPNPRYFTDGSGRAIYLAGSHNWHNFIDNGHRMAGTSDPPPVFDYNGYLDLLQSRHLNFFRLWRWEVPKWIDVQPPGEIHFAAQYPWLRTGPGAAADGKPRFDLTRFDPDYFARMRSRIVAARDRGIYVSVMLFDGSILQYNAWPYHPFSAGNNVNGVHAGSAAYYGANLRFLWFLPGKLGEVLDSDNDLRVRNLQEAYVRKVVDTVNDLDNVLFELCNETDASATHWQYELIRYLKAYEASKPKQHPVGMTFEFPDGSNDALFDSPADWISPGPGDASGNYRDDPPERYRGKVVVSDTDHLWGHERGDRIWVWKSFTRGLNLLFMDELTPSPTWQDSARDAMSQAEQWAKKIGLSRMIPLGALSETGYCLADRGREYLVFQPGNEGEFRLDLTDAPGWFQVEWFDVGRSLSLQGPAVRGGKRVKFTTPFGGPAVLYLKATPPPPRQTGGHARTRLPRHPEWRQTAFRHAQLCRAGSAGRRTN